MMDRFVMHMFYNEFIYFFSTSSHAFSLRISCMYTVRNYNYSTAVFFLLCIGFYQILNKVVY